MTLTFEKWSDLGPETVIRKRPKSVRQALKITSALALLAAGGYAMLAEQGYIASENAVVSAYVVSLRMPIEGFVSDIAAGVGATAERGGIIARIENPRVDNQRFSELRSQLKRIHREQAAVETEYADLEQLRIGLEARSRSHAQVSSARISGLVGEADGVLAARVARLNQLRRDLDRKEALAASGAVSHSELDRLRGEVDVAHREVDAQKAHSASLRTEADAARHGVVADPGANDVAYSAQRADEIAIRLAFLKRTSSTLEAEAEETADRLAAEERRIALMRANDLTAPSSGMVWKLGTSDGERLGVGDTAAEIVDCAAAFVVAYIPQDRVPDIEIGAQAHFRLAGEHEERVGRILSVTGEAALVGERNLAAVPSKQSSPTATVRVSAPASRNVAGECMVGRTARVLLPVAGGGTLSRFLHGLI